jgi:outer membrane protein TolC
MAEDAPALRAARAAVTSAETRLAEATAGWFPTLDVSATLAPTYDRSGDALSGTPPDDALIPKGVPWGPYLTGRVLALQPLYQFGRVSEARAAARARALAARSAEGVARAAVQAALVDAYLAAWTDRALLDELEDQEAGVAAVRAAIGAALAAGTEPALTPRELHKVDAGAAGLRADRARAAATLETDLARLAALTGRAVVPAESPAALAAGFAAPPPLLAALRDTAASVVPDAAVTRALDARPDLAVLRLGVAERAAATRLSAADVWPRLSLAVEGTLAIAPGVMNQSSPTAYDPYNGLGLGAAAVLRWTVAPASVVARVDRGNAETAAAAAALRAAERNAAAEIAAALNDALAAAPVLAAAHTSLAAARRWLWAAWALEGLGLRTPTERLGALGAVAGRTRDVLAAEADLARSALKVRLALGEDLRPAPPAAVR